MKVSSNWKIIAIVFVVLFVIENLIFIWAYFASEDDIDNETLCLTEICSVESGFEAYNYDIDTHVCACYKDSILVKQQIIN